MIYQVKVSGLYNRETLQQLQSSNVRHFGLDLRPKSFNFIQHHVTLALIDTLRADDRLYLHFHDESDVVIKKFIDDIRSQSDRAASGFSAQQLKLEFSGRCLPEKWAAYGVPFWVHWSREHQLADLHKTEHLEGIILPEVFFRELVDKNEFYRFVDQLIKFRVIRPALKLSLALSDSSHAHLVSPDHQHQQLTHFVQEMMLHCQINFLELGISSFVEERYRHPNFQLLKQVVYQSGQMIGLE